jgi:hypothetical protein
MYCFSLSIQMHMDFVHIFTVYWVHFYFHLKQMNQRSNSIINIISNQFNREMTFEDILQSTLETDFKLN